MINELSLDNQCKLYRGFPFVQNTEPVVPQPVMMIQFGVFVVGMVVVVVCQLSERTETLCTVTYSHAQRRLKLSTQRM